MARRRERKVEGGTPGCDRSSLLDARGGEAVIGWRCAMRGELAVIGRRCVMGGVDGW